MASQSPSMVSSGDPVYVVDVQITGMTDFGVTLEDVLSGARLPPSGVRLDVAWEGSSSGLLAGRVSGIDYLSVRPDGRIELHIHGVITTDEDARVSFFATGMATMNSDGTARLIEFITAISAFEQYAWINQTALRGEGLVNLASGNITVTVTAA